MPNPVSFRYFKTSSEIIQLAVMLYVRFPLSLRNVEGLLHERGLIILNMMFLMIYSLHKLIIRQHQSIMPNGG